MKWVFAKTSPRAQAGVDKIRYIWLLALNLVLEDTASLVLNLNFEYIPAFGAKFEPRIHCSFDIQPEF